ncbi:MAG: HU family DNA-binding protein [Oscillospiraceae bacterium]|jgi:DNA-binding protein HU-beta
MTKSELISSVAESAGISKKDAGKAVTAVFDTITDAMKKGDKVSLVGFGTFAPKHRAARTAMNPATKKKIKIPAMTVPSFKAGKALKDALKK